MQPLSIEDDLPARRIQGYGWRPDLPDHRDLLLSALPPLPAVPRGLRAFSLRGREPEPCYDQGNLGSCTANGIGFCVQFERSRQGYNAFRPSRLFIYYWERFLEGSVDQDAGAMIRDGMKVVSRYGAPPETSWPYEPSRFKERPPDPSVQLGQDTQVLRYLRCSRDLAEIKRCLYAGFPVVMGFTVYGSFESEEVATSGLMPMPDRTEYVLGGHCVVWTGWDDDQRMPNTSELGALEARNSWGTAWGDHGHFWMPYAYSQDRGLSSDFWTVRQVEGHKRVE